MSDERKYLESQRLNWYSLAYRAHLDAVRGVQGAAEKRDAYRVAAKEIERRLGR